MKTEHLLLILGGAYLLFFRRPTVGMMSPAAAVMNQAPNTGGSGQPGQTAPTQGGQFFNNAADNTSAAGGGPAPDDRSLFDKITLGDIGKAAGNLWDSMMKASA